MILFYSRLSFFCCFTLFVSVLGAQNLTLTTQIGGYVCGATCFGKVAVLATGGVAPYTYDWSDDGAESPDNDQETVANLCAGTYTVTVTDAFGIAATATVTLVQTANVVLTSILTPNGCQNICTGAINLDVAGGTAPYTYLWSTSATTQDINGLCNGTYQVTVTESGGCTAISSFNIDAASSIEAVACATDANCFGASTGSIDLSVSGGAPPYTYHWSISASTQDITNLPAGTYTVTVNDQTNCSATASVTVGQPTQIDALIAVTNVGSTGTFNGTIDLTVIGGTPPYTFLWSNGSNSADLNNLSAGTYTVTIIDSHGCTHTQSATVQAGGGIGNAGPLLLNGIITNTSCGATCTGSIRVTVSNGIPVYNAMWSGPNGQIQTFGSAGGSFFLFDQCAGTYCITVTDNQQLTASACYTIEQDQSLEVEIQSSNAAFCNYDPTNPPICEMVCPHTTVTYFFDPPLDCGQPVPTQDAVWTVSGAESYTIKPNNREVVVTWGESGPGLISLISSSTSACFEDTRCVTVVEETVAKFSTDPPVASGAVLQLCKGQTVFFKNESLHAEQYEWLFEDDLSTTNEENPQHTFLIPGNFTVTLIARSNCLCADTTVLQVEVLDSEPPLLDCVGSVCPGEKVTYSTSSNCSSYSWQVSPNGTILQGGGSADNTITVEWGQGPSGTIALSASGCGSAACPQASLFSIPIISDNAEIRGNESVCTGSEEAYSIDQFDGTGYTWALSSGGSIVRGQGTNKVSVAWTDPPSLSTTHWLSVVYNNCYLGCGGQDSIPVKILPPFFVQGKVEFCEKTPTGFTSKLSEPLVDIACDWVIYQENGSVFSTFSNTSSINFPLNAPAGKYRIIATPAVTGQTCAPDAELVVTIIALPPNPAAIAGPAVICPGNPLNYELLGNEPYSIQWTISNGTPVNQVGSPINVTWNNNNPRWLSAAYVSTDGLGCKSDTIKFDVAGISNMSISGSSTKCEGSVGSYSTESYPNFSYQWAIIPAAGGAIKSGQGTNAVEIFWQTPGSYKVRVSACGFLTEFNVTVVGTPNPTLTYQDPLCAGETTLVSTSAAFSTYSWQSANGTPISANPTVNLFTGAYLLEVTDVNGCKGSSDFNIDPMPNPTVSLTTSDATGFCNNSSFVTLTALVPSQGTYSFAWFQDGNPVGTNSVTYTTNQYGLYTVVATNENGCVSTASPVILQEICGPGGYTPVPPQPYCPAGAIQIAQYPSQRCDSVSLHFNDVAGTYLPGSAFWATGVSGGSFITQPGDEVNFTYPDPGKYILFLQVTLQNGAICQVIDSVNIGAAALFSQQLACPGDSTHFVDESSRLPQENIVSWQWDFGAPGNMDVSNEPSPGYPYPSPGNYTATLTITTTTGCTATYSENVFVPDVPAPTFNPPLANCAGNATELVLSNPAGITQVAWDFGHPASGALNSGTGNTVYHNYSPFGNYTVTLTATNSYGCTASFSQLVNIVANPFSGTITPATPVICEGKSITLVSPIGPGASYVWSDGSNSPTLIVSEEGVYDVTLSNGNGCTYSPPEKTVEVNPAPVGVIKALELNELGQVIGVSYPTLSVCAGEDVTLQVQDNGTYTYEWSDGNGSDEILVFSDDRDNLLTEGTHTFTVTVTNPATGCTAVLPPFVVTVNPVPSGFSVAATSACAGTPNTLNYFGQQPPNWQIFWNNGETGASIVTEDPGLYFVRVINEFGCSAQSNIAVVFPGPNIGALPAGCHERCNPDTLCLPLLPEIVAWQWYLEGNPILGATSNQFVATQSGTYYAQLLDVNGCQAQSADLTLDLYDGFGNILGQVWSDVNDNGVVDNGDTLVALIPVQLLQNGAVVSTDTSAANGGFEWQNILSTGYTVQIDSGLLSPLWEVVILSDSVKLTGCGGNFFTDLLVDAYTCPPLLSTVQLSACAGTSASYNGSSIPAGQSQDFSYQSYLGCDSIVTVSVALWPLSSSSFSTAVCPNGSFVYLGATLSAGQTQAFTLTNAVGCDSVVTVTVNALPVSSSTFTASVCPGSTYSYQGSNLSVGQTQAFTLTNVAGCDSIVTVTVNALPTPSSTLGAFVCAGETYSYQGVNLAVGQVQTFTLTAPSGCDSIVTVIVSALPVSASAFTASVCAGGTYSYQGATLAIGQTQAFTLTNTFGCDSIVSVTVAALPAPTSAFTAKVCQGNTYSYQGASLAIGQSQSFTLSTPAGCDSVVTVTVAALPVSSNSFSEGVCPGETYSYQGQALAAGTVQDFILTNFAGCDSVVTLSIFEKATSVALRQENVCPGEAFTFNGVQVAIGESKDFHFDNSVGCDSTVTVMVSGFPALDFAVVPGTSCPNKGSGSLSVSVTPGGGQATAYSINGADFQASPMFEGLAAGAYNVTVKDVNGCLNAEPAVIDASPNLELELPGAFVIPCDSVVVTLAPQLGGDTTGLQLNWSNGAQTPAISTGEVGTVWLEASNHCGERLRKEAEVMWADASGQPIDIYVPNVFSPDAKNADNTVFRAFLGNNFSLLEYRMEVYDRWGNLMFRTERPDDGWEGLFRDKMMEPGVYVWQLWAKVAFCGRELDLYKKGDVTVER